MAKPKRSTGSSASARARFSLPEKRRIVELTLCEGASVRAIAHENGISRNSLHRWQALYRAGALGESVSPAASDAGGAFLPVRIVPSGAALPPGPRNVVPRYSSVVHVVLASGASLRIESSSLDADLLRLLVAEMQR
jgi:transposase-like protein